MLNAQSDFDAFREDFILYLAARLGVSKDEALVFLGEWLVELRKHRPERACSGSQLLAQNSDSERLAPADADEALG